MPQLRAAQPPPAPRRSYDALAMLRADHRRIQQLIADYDTGHPPHAQGDIAHDILLELGIHADLEAYVFDEAGEAAPTPRGHALQTASRRERRAIQGLLQELRTMGPDDPQFLKTFDELLVHVEHHMEADEAQMFPVVEAARTRQPSARSSEAGATAPA
ncbi:MAG TPA: hemerythrin domain-containing protein [Candidatus Tectomicrobia bacterium]